MASKPHREGHSVESRPTALGTDLMDPIGREALVFGEVVDGFKRWNQASPDTCVFERAATALFLTPVVDWFSSSVEQTVLDFRRLVSPLFSEIGACFFGDLYKDLRGHR